MNLTIDTTNTLYNDCGKDQTEGGLILAIK